MKTWSFGPVFIARDGRRFCRIVISIPALRFRFVRTTRRWTEGSDRG